MKRDAFFAEVEARVRKVAIEESFLSRAREGERPKLPIDREAERLAIAGKWAGYPVADHLRADHFGDRIHYAMFGASSAADAEAAIIACGKPESFARDYAAGVSQMATAEDAAWAGARVRRLAARRHAMLLVRSLEVGLSDESESASIQEAVGRDARALLALVAVIEGAK